jgi:hypothetical protein
MATTTPNYGWTVPTSTDLVKDGATAIETLGDAIDASMNTALGTKKAGMVLLNTTSFSAVASQSFNNVFSATYDNYLILFSGNLSTIASLEFRLRVGGVDNSTANSYLRQFVRAENTVVSAGRVTSNIAKVGQGENNLRNSFELTIFNPFQATATPFTSVTNVSESSALIFDIYSSMHNVTSSFDGFTLIASSGTMTGSVSVYGYNK